MIKIKFPWDIEEEEKEEKTPIGSYFGGGFGVSDLIKETQEEKEKDTPIIKFDWDEPAEPLMEGLPMSKPEDKPKSILNIGKDPKMEEIHKINFESFQLWFKELKESKDKVAFLKGEGQSPELKELRKQYNEKAPYMYGKSEQWISNVSMIAVGVGMVQQVADTLVTSGFKVKGVKFNAKEIKGVMERAYNNYIPETGKFKSAISNNDYAAIKQINQMVKMGKGSPAMREMLEKIVEKTGGLTFQQQVNIFGGTLRMGVSPEDIVKSFTLTRQLTQEMIQGLDPVKVSQVTQALLNTSPALASEFLKAVEKPEGIPEPKDVSLAKPTKEEIYAEKYGIPLDKIKVTELPKADIEAVSEKTIEEMEAKFGKERELTKEKVLEAVEKPEAPKVEPKITEIPKLTKTERDALINTFEADEGISLTGISLPTKANEKLIAKLEDKKYIKDGLLTEKGIELSNVLKGRIEAEEKGIPITGREIKRPLTDKQIAKEADNEEIITGKINGVDYYTNKNFMLKGELKDVPISQLKPDFKKIIPEGEGVKINPTIFSHDEKDTFGMNLVWFDNKVPIQEKYYDFIIKKYPEAEFRSVEKVDQKNPIATKPIKIYENNEFVGVVMPVKIEKENIPENVLKKVPKVEIKPTPKPEISTEKVISPIEKAEVEPPITEVKPEVKPEIKPEIPKVEAKTYDLKKDLSTEQKVTGNKLIGQIQKLKNEKGLTGVEFTALKKKYGLSPHLATDTRMMTMPQLEAVLKAVNRARPKIVGHRQVIKLKTENKIQSLKENLIDKLQMSEEAYGKVLKDVGVYKEPKYVDAKNFITEQKGKEVIYRLIDEANILRSTMPYDKAVSENPVIKKFVDKEKSAIKREGDKRLADPKEWNSMRVYAQRMEEITGEHIYRLYEDLIDVSLENKEKLGLFIRDFHEFKEILTDKKALKRISDYIGSKSNLKDKPVKPPDITKKEIELAKKIEDMLIDYRARARTQKFLDNVEHPEGMPQYIQYKKEIDKAKDIYESKGYDDLVEYMKTQEWGIIKNGYDPDQVWSPRIRLYKPAPQTFGKHNIKVHTAIEYKEQDTTIIERLMTYKRSMDNLVEMRPKVKALITLVDQNLDKFNNPKRVQEVIEVFSRELKGYNRPEGLVERILNRVYAQAMQTIILPSVVMFGRNMLQNIAFGYDKTIIIDPRNKKLSDSRVDFLNTYMSQIQAMKVDWFMVGEKPLPGLTWLTKMVNKVGIYPYSDQANRHWGFWGKINQVDRGFKGVDANSTEKQIDRAMRGARFDDIERTERIMALEILAKDGYEAMARYVARAYVADTEFQYNRAERSPMEMGRGKWLSNLMLFPRSYWELLLKMGNKFKRGGIKQKARAFKVLASIIVGGLIVGEGYKKVTGRRQNPYNPLRLLAYEPGGLAIGTVEAFSDVITNTIMALNGDERAAGALATAVPRLADMMIPFYDYMLRGIEATVPITYRGQHVNKRIDVLALRELRRLVNERLREMGWNIEGYKPNAKGYYVERKFYEKLQYIIAGAGVDVGIKEKAKGKPVPSVKFDWDKELETKSIIKFDW